eukprot:1367587-Ditylum_brightwellii.AAC.1
MEFLQMEESVRALYAEIYNPTAWYNCVIDKIVHTEESEEELSCPKFQVTFFKYINTEIVTLERAPPDYHHSCDYHHPPIASSTQNAADLYCGCPHERSIHHSHPPHHHDH